MPIEVNGQTYYRTAEVCQMVGISRSTLFRSLKQGVFSEAKHRDWRGWRLFTEEEITKLNAKINQVVETDHLSPSMKNAEK
jgi:predicted site-specific integrase-resolvase